jgi:hypothetical protein
MTSHPSHSLINELREGLCGYDLSEERLPFSCRGYGEGREIEREREVRSDTHRLTERERERI